MSENSWANKYRPKNLDEVIGQTLTKQKIKTLNQAGRLPKVMLLSGNSGIGKTTLALIISKLGKCENLQQGNACETCPSCLRLNKMIEENQNGIDSDVYIYNISKLNKAEDADEIIENMSATNYLRNTKRFFILDEIQVASLQAQTRFLKIAEEQPKGLYIILCTTNPEKLIEPLKNRCISYSLKSPNANEIVERLVTICTREGINYTKTGLALLAKVSNFSVRKSINKLQELSALGAINKESIQQNLEVMSNDFYQEFLKAIKIQSITKLSTIYTQLSENSLSFHDFIVGFSEYLTDILDISNLVYPDIYTKDEIKTIKSFVDELTISELLRIIVKTKEYFNVYTDDKFMFYSFGIELMNKRKGIEQVQKITNLVQESPTVEKSDEENAIKKYREVSKELTEETTEVTDEFLSTEDAISKLGNTIIDF